MKELNDKCDALVNKCLLAMRVTAEDKGQMWQQLAVGHGGEEEVFDTPTVGDGPIAWPQVPEGDDQ